MLHVCLSHGSDERKAHLLPSTFITLTSVELRKQSVQAAGSNSSIPEKNKQTIVVSSLRRERPAQGHINTVMTTMQGYDKHMSSHQKYTPLRRHYNPESGGLQITDVSCLC